MRIKPIFSKTHGITFQDSEGNSLSLDRLKEELSNGSGPAKTISGHLHTDFANLIPLPARETTKFGLDGLENVTFYSVTNNHEQLIIPSLTLLAGIFKPFDRILSHGHTLGFWETRVIPTYSEGATIFRAHSSLWRLTGINANIHPNALAPFIFLSVYQSAQYCFYSFINNCLAGILAPENLPIGNFSCSLQKRRIGRNTYVVSDITVLAIDSSEEPIFKLKNHGVIEFRSIENLAGNRQGKIRGLTNIPTTQMNEVTVSDDEWKNISAVLEKGQTKKYPAREVFDAILVKLHERRPWSEINNVPKETLCSRYRTWTKTGQFQQSLNLLCEMRAIPH
jgi:hypothetical protein